MKIIETEDETVDETEDEREIGTVESFNGRSGDLWIKRPFGIKRKLLFKDEANRWKVK